MAGFGVCTWNLENEVFVRVIGESMLSSSEMGEGRARRWMWLKKERSWNVGFVTRGGSTGRENVVVGCGGGDVRGEVELEGETEDVEGKCPYIGVGMRVEAEDKETEACREEDRERGAGRENPRVEDAGEVFIIVPQRGEAGESKLSVSSLMSTSESKPSSICARRAGAVICRLKVSCFEDVQYLFASWLARPPQKQDSSSSEDRSGVRVGGLGNVQWERAWEKRSVCFVVGEARKGRTRGFWSWFVRLVSASYVDAFVFTYLVLVSQFFQFLRVFLVPAPFHGIE